MESLDGFEWDVLVDGTGLQESLLALALSKSGKKILHVDRNEYYGGAEAALSLQEAQEWVEKSKADESEAFSNAALYQKEDASSGSSGTKLGFSRAYSLALAPHIIYTRSSLLPLLVSSRSDQSLEFLAVGSWFVYSANAEGTAESHLSRVPSSREDLFADDSIPPRAKRSLMKFLRFIADFENQEDTWKDQGETAFHDFLSSRFGLPAAVQAPFQALTLSPHSPSKTTTSYALPRIARHLRSIGLFGPGFGAVIPKWGGLAEIAQVGCRAGAVGGATYMLGTGLERTDLQHEEDAAGEGSLPGSSVGQLKITLTTGDKVTTKWLASSSRDAGSSATNAVTASSVTTSRCISIISSPLKALFPPLAEGAPQPAVAVVVFPSATLDSGNALQEEQPPVHLFVHSSETGECPAGQSVLYGSVTGVAPDQGSLLLDKAVNALLAAVDEPEIPKVLWKLQYEQQCSLDTSLQTDGHTIVFPRTSPELVFDDKILEQVMEAWQTIVGGEEGEGFMKFPAREDQMEDEAGEE